MHEVDMTRALIETVQDWLEAQPDFITITRIHLIVGDFTCVEPDSLTFAYQVQSQGTALAGSALSINRIPLIAHCHTCCQDYQPEIGSHYACPTCQSPMEDIRSGRELKIDWIETEVIQNTDSVKPVIDPVIDSTEGVYAPTL